MYLLLSSRARGTLQVVRVLPGGTRPRVKVKAELGAAAREIRSFSISNQHFLAVARDSGILQLYERQCGPTLAYKLVKEWKNSVCGPGDQVVSVGSFRNQYMYTCSRDGKFVVRDLVNDDADDSCKAYSIERPVHCVHVTACGGGRVLVAAGSLFTQIKFYDLDFSHRVPEPPLKGHLLQARRLSSHETTCRLAPLLSATTLSESSHNANMVSSILLVSAKYICVGTQLGDMLVFGTDGDTYKTLCLSHFPINTLTSLNADRYVVYTDTMSKVGVVDTCTWKVVNFYDFLKIGPTVLAKVYTCGKFGKFRPLYVVATTVSGTLVIYRLQDDNSYELKLTVSGAGVMPSFDIMDPDAYELLEKTFGGAIKRQKTDSWELLEDKIYG